MILNGHKGNFLYLYFFENLSILFGHDWPINKLCLDLIQLWNWWNWWNYDSWCDGVWVVNRDFFLNPWSQLLHWRGIDIFTFELWFYVYLTTDFQDLAYILWQTLSYKLHIQITIARCFQWKSFVTWITF